MGSTLDLEFSPWPMLVPTLMEASSSSALPRPSGLMESMLCSVRSVGAWMSSRRSGRLDLSLARLARRSSSQIVDNARNTHSGIDEKTNVKNKKKKFVNLFFFFQKKKKKKKKKS